MPKRKGDKEVISIGDKGDVFELDTSLDLTAGVDTVKVRVDRFISTSSSWAQVVERTATVITTTTVKATMSVTTSPFTVIGKHAARSLVNFTGGGLKHGDQYVFHVQRDWPAT